MEQKHKRMDKFFKHLKQLGTTATEVSRITGIAIPTMTNYRSGRASPSKCMMRCFEIYFGLNPDWVMTGEGEMIIQYRKEDVTRKEKQLRIVVRCQQDDIKKLKQEIRWLTDKLPDIPYKDMQNLTVENCYLCEAILKRPITGFSFGELVLIIPWIIEPLRLSADDVSKFLALRDGLLPEKINQEIKHFVTIIIHNYRNKFYALRTFG
ncbi:MAG: helix-turn-helix transcriptional regulator [SAR324 cluster bacterium]|nr:helix-turn-helix transcriptional regulator [SAR324 cluster bacterium]